jgi:hypothetical protein
MDGVVTDRDRSGRFVAGNAALRHGRQAKAVLKAEIAVELGGNLSTADEILLTRAVELLTVRPKSRTDSVRAANTANRILQTLRAKYATIQKPLRTARELGL